MHKSTLSLIGLSLLTLAACSTKQPLNEELAVAPPTSATPPLSEQVPSLTELKNGKLLNIVRIMDGAACKNAYQGVKGTFLVYADPADVERIKREKGSQVFAEFENKIQTLASDALQKATDSTNLAEDPFALSAEGSRQKLANELSASFQSSIDSGLKQFYRETRLLIDVTAFPPSLIFYQSGCEATLADPDVEREPQK